jgi:hypothetical protein
MMVTFVLQEHKELVRITARTTHWRKGIYTTLMRQLGILRRSEKQKFNGDDGGLNMVGT